MSDGATSRTDTDDRFDEPWPAWQTPPAASADALAPRPPTQAFGGSDAAVELENLRAGIAQVSALVPLVGPATAYLANGRFAFARREAAKAFNGQLVTILLMLAVVTIGILAGGYYSFHPAAAVAEVLLFGGWILHALIGTLSAFKGRDWTSPFTRAFHLTVLPEGEPDTTRRSRRHRGR